MSVQAVIGCDLSISHHLFSTLGSVRQPTQRKQLNIFRVEMLSAKPMDYFMFIKNSETCFNVQPAATSHSPIATCSLRLSPVAPVLLSHCKVFVLLPLCGSLKQTDKLKDRPTDRHTVVLVYKQALGYFPIPGHSCSIERSAGCHVRAGNVGFITEGVGAGREGRRRGGAGKGKVQGFPQPSHMMITVKLRCFTGL